MTVGGYGIVETFLRFLGASCDVVKLPSSEEMSLNVFRVRSTMHKFGELFVELCETDGTSREPTVLSIRCWNFVPPGSISTASMRLMEQGGSSVSSVACLP